MDILTFAFNALLANHRRKGVKGAYIQDTSMFLHTNVNPHTSDLTPKRWQQHAGQESLFSLVLRKLFFYI